MDSSPRLTSFVKQALGHRQSQSLRPLLAGRGCLSPPVDYPRSISSFLLLKRDVRSSAPQSFITPLLPVFSCFVLRSLFTFQDITPVHSLPVQEQHNFRSLWIHTAGSGRSTRRALVVYPLVQFGASQETALYI